MLDRIFDLNIIRNKIIGFSDQAKKEYYDYLVNEFGILFTFNSNRIEGTNTDLSLNDTRKILNNTYDLGKVIDKIKQGEINETINHQNAFKYIFNAVNEKEDIIGIIKNLHKIVGFNIIENSGNYKETDNYIISSSGKEISFTKSDLVNQRMLELKNRYEGAWQELTAFERTVCLHMAIVNIHPFSDGNVRVARLIMNYEIIKNNYPPVSINESQKLSYVVI